MQAARHGAEPLPRTAAATAAATATAAPRPARHGLHDHPNMLLLHQVAMVMAAMAQTSTVVSTWGKTHHRKRLSVLATSVIVCLVAAFVVLRPRIYWHRRNWLLPVLRILACAMPSWRSTKVGTALILEYSARPGWRGAAADLLRIAVGTRMLGATLVPLFLTLPPSITLATQLVLALCISNSAGYCSLPLLSDPLTQQRMLAAAQAVVVATLPCVVVLPWSAYMTLLEESVLQGTANADHVCRATLTFMNIGCCVLLPTLFTLYCTWTPSSAQQRQQQQRDAAAALGASWAERTSRQCSRLSATADGALEQALGQTALHRLLASWYVLVLSWWGARITSGP